MLYDGGFLRSSCHLWQAQSRLSVSASESLSDDASVCACVCVSARLRVVVKAAFTTVPSIPLCLHENRQAAPASCFLSAGRFFQAYSCACLPCQTVAVANTSPSLAVSRTFQPSRHMKSLEKR